MPLQLRSAPSAATRLSEPRASFGVPGRFLALARLSLVGAGLSMLPGCLIDDPPPYAAPKQTPPRLDTTRANPPSDQVIVTNVNEVVKFQMPVTSEDAGQELTAFLLLDYGGYGSFPDSLTLPATLAPSTLDDPESRELNLTWKVRAGITPGCHRLTLRVTHVANLDREKSPEVIDKKDLAEAYWFANINVSPENANSLVDCQQFSIGAQP